MKFLLPPPPPRVLPSRPDLSYIVDRTDLSVDEKIEMIIKEHSPVPLPFDQSTVFKYYKKFLAQYWKEDEEEGIVLEEDEDEDILDDEDEDILQDKEEQEGKKVLGDEKDPGGIVKRPPQEDPLEGEPVCKMPRAASPQGEEHNSKFPLV